MYILYISPWRYRSTSAWTFGQIHLYLFYKPRGLSGSFKCLFNIRIIYRCRSQRQGSLRRGSAVVQFLGLRIRIPRGYCCLSLLSVVCCEVDASRAGWSLVQRSPIHCSVPLCVTQCNCTPLHCRWVGVSTTRFSGDTIPGLSAGQAVSR